MTKQEILEYFKDINFMYNDSTRLDALSMMIDELLKEQDSCENCAVAIENRQPIVRCKDCTHRNNSLYCPIALLYEIVMKIKVFDFKVSDDWFCADGERKEE